MSAYENPKTPTLDAAMADVLLALPGGLTREQVGLAFDQLLRGDVPESQIAAFLYGLRVKGETVAEVQGIADSLLRAAPNLEFEGPVVDIVGTGGDRTGAISLSTPASVLVRACGVAATVVKHGNRGATTPTGAADVVEAWGVPLGLSPDQVAAVGREVGITFCFAARFHAALRYAGPVRRALGVSTVLNVVAPLSHPARPLYQLVGVADASRVDLVSETFRSRGSVALVVRGQDGLDKLSVTGLTDVTLVSAGRRSSFTVAPEDVGLSRSGFEGLLGSTATNNARQLAGVLGGGVAGPVTDAVVLNAAAACVLVEGEYDFFVDRLRDRVRNCQRVLASGAAGQVLQDWVAAAQRQLTAPDV